MIKKIIVRLNLLKIISLVLYIFRIFPIKKNKVCFINFSGKGYGDNPKYITEEILKENEGKTDEELKKILMKKDIQLQKAIEVLQQ